MTAAPNNPPGMIVSRKEMAEIRERVRLGLPVAAFLVEKLLRVIDRD
jgi:histidinol-phosphate/aromatic aminotransferase/cobyric acid decarboxylase-like protein